MEGSNSDKVEIHTVLGRAQVLSQKLDERPPTPAGAYSNN